MKTSKTAVLILLTVCLTLPGMVFAGPECEGTVTGGSIKPNTVAVRTGRFIKARLASTDDTVTNYSSTDWMDIFNLKVTLRGTARQCIKLNCTTEFAVNLSNFTPHAEFRALVDGNVMNRDLTNPVSMDEFYAEAVSYGKIDTATFNWWACGLKSRGTLHTVQVQMRPAYSGDAAVARKRTLLIEYRK